jgi:uncharacterized protein YggE
VATVRVRGTGTVPGDPDEAELVLEVTGVHATAEEAYADVAGRSEQLEALFGELGVDAAARSTVGVTLREHREYDEQGRHRHRGYAAANLVVVRLADPALLARLIREAVAAVDARVAGPRWRLARENPARAEACRLAALDARAKADAYAEALGYRLGAVVEAVEPAAGAVEPYGGHEERAFAAIDQPELPVAPGRLDARAALDVTFALEPA